MLGKRHADLGHMWSLLRDSLLLLDLPHQAVKVLVHLVLVLHLVLAFAVLEGLDISVYPFCDLIFFHFFLLLSFLLSLDLSV
jgi:hypothetical protein